MARLRNLSGREVRAILEAHGFVLVRQHESHRIMQLRLADTTISVPVPNHRQVKRGTLEAIINRSRLPRRLFEAGR